MRYCSVKNCVNNDVSFVIFIHQKWDFWVKLNLCRKVPGKKVSGKKTAGNKNFGKKVRILSSPWKNCQWK